MFSVNISPLHSYNPFFRLNSGVGFQNRALFSLPAAGHALVCYLTMGSPVVPHHFSQVHMIWLYLSYSVRAAPTEACPTCFSPQRRTRTSEGPLPRERDEGANRGVVSQGYVGITRYGVDCLLVIQCQAQKISP